MYLFIIIIIVYACVHVLNSHRLVKKCKGHIQIDSKRKELLLVSLGTEGRGNILQTLNARVNETLQIR